MVILAAEVHILHAINFPCHIFFLYTNFIHVADFAIMKYVKMFRVNRYCFFFSKTERIGLQHEVSPVCLILGLWDRE